MTMTKINIIFAADSNFLIGNTETNGIPWPREDYREDMKHFRSITSEVELNKMNYLVCGYKTYLSMKDIKSILKNRRLVVINKEAIETEYRGQGGAIHVKTFRDALTVCYKAVELNNCDKIFVIGGKKSIEESLQLSSNLINIIYLTQIKKSFGGDVYINKNLFKNFELKSCFKLKNMQFCQYIPKSSVYEEQQYLDIIRKILDEGIDCDDRTGVGIKSIFGVQMHFDLSKHFPLLTTKKMFTRGITEELLWFLRGETDANILKEKNVHIWDGNTTREFLDKVGLTHLKEGDIGETYGFLFRHLGAEYKGFDADYTGQGFDQVANVLDLIKNNPNSRRIIMNLWKQPFWGKACLPPCLFLYQFRVYNNTLSCSIYQRSGDIGLGVPFNIASAALMTYLFAHMTGLKPGKLIHTIGDAHIYKNHIKAMEEQITREVLPFPRLMIRNRKQETIEDYLASDFNILGYMSHGKIKMEMAV